MSSVKKANDSICKSFLATLKKTPVSVLCLSMLLVSAENKAETVIKDIEFAQVDSNTLLLDLYLPDNVDKPPLVIWIHGGAWNFGSKEDIHVENIVDHGFALASVNFRNSPEGLFPAQLHDINASVRFLRAEASNYGFNADKIALWGYSSGGHLAALLGSSNGDADFEGLVGNDNSQSSDIQAVVDFSGPSNFLSILNQSTPHGLSVREPALEQLMGSPPSDPDIAAALRNASPVYRVNQDSVPILIMHGVQDNQVPINQSLELESAYRENERSVEVNWLVSGEHTSGEYFESPYLEQVADFLNRTIR